MTIQAKYKNNLKCRKLLVIVEKLSCREWVGVLCVYVMHNWDYKKYNNKSLYKIYDR